MYNGTIGLTTAIYLFFDSPMLLALLYMGQPPSSVILQNTVYIYGTLVVGRRQHSESIEVALEWSKEV